MTVREIFALRKQGKIEEAYEAIRPIYREHKGKYTTLCMFWTASDVFKLRLEQGRVEEAEKIYKALQRLIPSIEDDPEHKAKGFIHYAEDRLIKAASKREESQACLNFPEREQARPEVKASEKFRKWYFAIKSKTAPAVSPSSVLASSAGEAASSAATVPADSPAGLKSGQQAVLACIREHPGLRVPGIETETGIPAKSIERHIKALIARALIEHRGSKKTGGYHAL
jgi:hypothetical protein